MFVFDHYKRHNYSSALAEVHFYLSLHNLNCKINTNIHSDPNMVQEKRWFVIRKNINE